MKQGRAAHPAQQGFSLVEMAAVLVVIAILASIALPTYLDRRIRQQIDAALPLADIAKKPIAAAWAAQQPLPADNTAAGLPAPDKIVNNFVSAVTVQDGAIHITFGNQAAGPIKGKVLSVRPAVVPDAPIVPVAWVCGNANPPNKMSALGSNQTTAPVTYLPLDCRLRN